MTTTIGRKPWMLGTAGLVAIVVLYGLWRLIFGAIALALVPASGAGAQSRDINELKGKIFDAHMAQQMFAGGLKYCNELNGKSFYYQLRNRILNLEEYFQSLENLVKAGVYNPARRRACRPL